MVFALSAFWTAFVILIVWIPLILLWVFALVELFKNREHFAGWEIALWLLGIVILPILGPAVYLIYAGLHSDTMKDAVEFQDELADERSTDPNADQ